MDEFERGCSLMPPWIRQAVKPFNNAEEIRLRCSYPPSVIIAGKELRVSELPVEDKDLEFVLELASGASIHSVASGLRWGYICNGGLRIGVCGEAVYKDNDLIGFRKYSSIALRIPHNCVGAIPQRISAELIAAPLSTLIAAPPGVGKTTALRELVRILSESGRRVALIDERKEISGDGICLGPCTDILTNVPKARAAMMLLRAANPQIIAMDEITQTEDAEAIVNIAGCGVQVIATAHADRPEEMLKRPAYRRLFDEGIFEKLLIITLSDGKRRYRLERINL